MDEGSWRVREGCAIVPSWPKKESVDLAGSSIVPATDMPTTARTVNQRLGNRTTEGRRLTVLRRLSGASLRRERPDRALQPLPSLLANHRLSHDPAVPTPYAPTLTGTAALSAPLSESRAAQSHEAPAQTARERSSALVQMPRERRTATWAWWAKGAE